jgi:hypothetical protein
MPFFKGPLCLRNPNISFFQKRINILFIVKDSNKILIGNILDELAFTYFALWAMVNEFFVLKSKHYFVNILLPLHDK